MGLFAAPHTPSETPSKETKKGEKKRLSTCPKCGWTIDDFRQTGKLSCPYDYKAFKWYLKDILHNTHGGLKHKGKVPENFVDNDTKRRLKILRKRLDEAVGSEQYEKAAELRDKIKRLEGKDAKEKDNA